jgi:hypothetical protein
MSLVVDICPEIIFRRSVQESGLRGPDWENLFTSRYPLPPRSPGIIGLEENYELIYGAQQLAGKILLSKDLRTSSFSHLYRLRLDDNGLVADGRQGQMSQSGCEFPGQL